MSVEEFLASLPSKGTTKVYKYGLNKFLSWYGKAACPRKNSAHFWAYYEYIFNKL